MGEASEIGWSAHEILRAKDFAAMSPEEFARTRALISQIVTSRPSRRTRRLRPHPRGERLDLRRLARSSLPRGGSQIERTFQRRSRSRASLVVLCDVSGSMEAYTRALLLFLHAVVGSGRGWRSSPSERADPADPRAGHARSRRSPRPRRVVDWASGTRIGASLKQFNDLWGRRALLARRRRRDRLGRVGAADARGRGDGPPRAGRLCGRLGQSAQGHPDYQPLAGGMRAALPYVDRFVAGHNVASLEELAEVLAGIERRHAA